MPLRYCFNSLPQSTEYNGYKVYWQDGGQLSHPGWWNYCMKSMPWTIWYSVWSQRRIIQYIDETIDNAFANASIQYGTFETRTEAKKTWKLSLAFPYMELPLPWSQGYWNKLAIPKFPLLKRKQSPMAIFQPWSPQILKNPEALSLALELAENVQADLVIGTDPDCDRLGIAGTEPRWADGFTERKPSHDR